MLDMIIDVCLTVNLVSVPVLLILTVRYLYLREKGQ